MTNLEKLYEIVAAEDEDKLYEWLEEFAFWFDPGGWWDKDSTKDDFLDDEWRE